MSKYFTNKTQQKYADDTNGSQIRAPDEAIWVLFWIPFQEETQRQHPKNKIDSLCLC